MTQKQIKAQSEAKAKIYAAAVQIREIIDNLVKELPKEDVEEDILNLVCEESDY